MIITMEALDRQKQELISSVEEWQEPRLAFRSSPESWTVPEIFDHLARTENWILSAAQRGLANPHRIGLRDKAGVLFVGKVFRSERRVKIPVSAKPSFRPPTLLSERFWNAGLGSVLVSLRL